MPAHLIDMVGQVFGKLTVISRHVEKAKDGAICWLCQCEDGNQIVVSGVLLRSGIKKSCGCLVNSIKHLTGQKFGRLTVIAMDTSVADSSNNIYWMCKCNCGKQTVVKGCNLTTGLTKSCGCFNHEIRKLNASLLHAVKKRAKLYGVDYETAKQDELYNAELLAILESDNANA